MRSTMTGGGGGGYGVGMMMQEEEEEEEDDTSIVLRSSGPPPQQRHLCRGWQRFLRKNTIRVLLVETDDSTRQVVTALLHHCMYQVIPVENGRQAWTYLEDMQNSIDLVLTEVVMPALSGVSLLSRIVNHNTRKNIPVIMMSSNDAMGTVFKCLSKGAVDFLVKPIRKNELKNLWQHVWRRCHSSSPRLSESGIQMQNCSKPKNVDEYENSGSNDDDDASTGLDARDDSDNGSGTQAESSWTKRAEASAGPQALSQDELAAPPDSNCAQEIYPKSEMCSNRWLPGTNNRNCKKQKETNDHFKGKDLVIGAPRNFNTYFQSSLGERPMKPTDRRCEYSPHNNLEAMMENLEEPIVHAADLIGSMAKNLDAQQVEAADAPNFSSKLPEGKDKNHDNILPSLELSLKRTRPTGDGTNVIQDEQRNVLIRSDLSAFTRYHTTVASNQGGTAFVGSCSPRDNSSEAMKTDSTYNMKSNSDAAPTKQSPNGSTTNNDMGSTSKKTVTESTTKEIVMPPSATKATRGHTSAFHPVPVQQRTPPANATGKEVANGAAKMARRGEVQSNNLSQHSRTILHYVHFDVEHENNGGSGVFDPQSGSSNAFDPPAEGHAADYGVNGSNSGSNNGSTTAVNAEGPSKETADGAISKSGLNGSGHDMYLKRFTQREHRMAAVIKFRQKRKERNFGKKVRYQSRKRLAEQRPRVRGQFVRQSVQDEEEGKEEEKKKAAR